MYTVFGHSGPVYQCKWSPIENSVYLSCGADWTIRLWKTETDQPLCEFQSGKFPVNDICWSNHCSSVFGSVSDDGKVEIWDLSFSLLTPVIAHSVLDHSLMRLSFSPDAPSVLTGDDNGTVMVYKIRNFRNAKPTEAETNLKKFLSSR
jgi:WD40 repeat protein